MLFPKVSGIGRDVDNEQSLAIYLDRRPTDDEMRRIHDFLNDPYLQSEAEFRGLRERQREPERFPTRADVGSAEIEQAKQVFRDKPVDADGFHNGSTSYLQRKMQWGYNRAAAVIEALEAAGFLSPRDNRGRRRINLN